MTTSKLIFSGLVMIATLGVQAQGITAEANTKANKTSFFQGEPLALDIIVTNNSDQSTALCPCSRWKLFSKTYQLEGDALKAIAPGPNPPKVSRSHPAVHSKATGAPVTCTCEVSTYGSIIIPKGSSVHYPILLNTCDTFHGCYKGGVWLANLPVGEYEFTYYLFFPDAPALEKKIVFNIVEPTHSQSMYLQKLASIYDFDSIDNWLQLIGTTHEPAIVDKILTRLITQGYMGTHAAFWADHVGKYSNEALLIDQLSRVAMMDDNDDRRNRVDFYQRIINNLKGKDEKINDAFLNQIESANLSKPNRGNYTKISPDKIAKIRNDWTEMKKLNKKDK